MTPFEEVYAIAAANPELAEVIGDLLFGLYDVARGWSNWYEWAEELP